MKRQILSVVLALCLCISFPSAVYAWQEDSLLQEEEFTKAPASGSVTRGSTIPAPTEVYGAMIALKDQDAYKGGTTWTDNEPYSASKGYYRWKGGTLGGTNIAATGCVAFAFVLSDTAFGSLPARMYAKGEFAFTDIRAGDILRVSNDAHTVIVLEVSDAGVVVAEGNNSGKVHWGRAISRAEVMSNTSHYITRYPEGYVPPDDPTANDIISKGILDGGLTWTLTKAGTLTISGKGAMPDFSGAGEQPWSENSGKIRKVAIENGVTRIGSCAFWDCGVLSAEIPSSVTMIGNSAFRGSSIISAEIPSGVKTIGDSAFQGCKNLSSVTVSEGVEIIGQNAFNACTGLTSIALPASIGEVGAAAFCQCQSMTSVKFAAGSKRVKLGDNLFTGCYYLMQVTLPRNIDHISKEMFLNCLMLPGVEIPQGAESIEESAFASCPGFTTVLIPDSVKTIGRAAFANCPLKDIYFTGTEAQWSGIRKIGDTVSAVSKATIHYNYTPAAGPDPGTDDDKDHNNGGDSGDHPDNGNNTDSSGNTGNGSNTGIGGNTGNGSNTGNGGNTGSGSNTGNGSNAGSDEDQTPQQKPLAKGKTFTVGKVTYKVTKVGKEVQLLTSKSTARKVTVNTVTGTDGVKYKVTSIGAKAMQKNKKMTSLIMGANVKTIGANAFSGCTKLTKVTFGKHTATIGAGAFKGCTALKKTLTLPDSVKTIGAGAFSGCHKITAVTIGKTSKSVLKTIGKSTFSGCKKLGKVTIKSTKLKSAGKQAFKGTKSGLKVKVPSRQWKKYKGIFKKAGLKARQVTK